MANTTKTAAPKSAPTTDAPSVAPAGATLRDVPVKSIFADHEWNGRSEGWLTATPEDEVGMGFPGLVSSIEENGLQSPIIIRINPNKSKSDRDFSVVAGHRRYEAYCQVMLAKGETNPTIPAFILPASTTEAQAREINGLENVARENLTPPGLAKIVTKLSEQGLTQEKIGLKIGMQQTYVGKLLRIMKLDARIVDHWIKAVKAVPVQDMDRLEARVRKDVLTPDAAWDAYMLLVNPAKKEPKSAKDSALDSAKRAGTLLGTLHRAVNQTGVDCAGISFESCVGLGFVCKIADDGSMDVDLAAIAQAMRDAFDLAVKGEPAKPDTSDKRDPDAVKAATALASAAAKAGNTGVTKNVPTAKIGN